MSDVPSSEYTMPFLHDDVITEIFLRADHKTIGSCKLLSKAWLYRVFHPKFLLTHFQIKQKESRSLIAHIGYPAWKLRIDWITRLNAHLPGFNHFNLPFNIDTYGWFNVVGSQNGNICLRYSSIGMDTYLIVWNPLTNNMRSIVDPHSNHGCLNILIYSFGYVPLSLEYRLVHIFKKSLTDTLAWYMVYSSRLNK